MCKKNKNIEQGKDKRRKHAHNIDGRRTFKKPDWTRRRWARIFRRLHLFSLTSSRATTGHTLHTKGEEKSKHSRRSMDNKKKRKEKKQQAEAHTRPPMPSTTMRWLYHASQAMLKLGRTDNKHRHAYRAAQKPEKINPRYWAVWSTEGPGTKETLNWTARPMHVILKRQEARQTP